MPDEALSQKLVRFGEFEVDLQEGCLFKQGVKVRLPRQLILVLSTLLEHAGEVVTREELQKRLWPKDVFVDFEFNLNTLIARLREALGDSAEYPRYIETLPRRGYRFLATVSEHSPSPMAPPRRTRLIVLPFSNVGGDPAEDYLSDAMTDEIITALCQVAPDHLAVIARTTAMHYRSSNKDVAHIGRELGVDYAVEGGVRRSDDQVAMNVQLIQAADQTHIFAGKYEGKMHDLFGLQTHIAEDIMTHIPSVPGLGERGPVRKKPSEDVLAHQLLLQGRSYMYQLTPDGTAKARQCLEEAIARDPQFALAYDALGEVYWWMAFYGALPAKQASFIGLGNVLRALEIDPSWARPPGRQFHQKIDYNWPKSARDDTRPGSGPSPSGQMRYAASDLRPARGGYRPGRGRLEFDPPLQLRDG
jgi:TolB-like protein